MMGGARSRPMDAKQAGKTPSGIPAWHTEVIGNRAGRENEAALDFVQNRGTALTPIASIPSRDGSSPFWASDWRSVRC